MAIPSLHPKPPSSSRPSSLSTCRPHHSISRHPLQEWSVQSSLQEWSVPSSHSLIPSRRADRPHEEVCPITLARPIGSMHSCAGCPRTLQEVCLLAHIILTAHEGLNSCSDFHGQHALTPYLKWSGKSQRRAIQDSPFWLLQLGPTSLTARKRIAGKQFLDFISPACSVLPYHYGQATRLH